MKMSIFRPAGRPHYVAQWRDPTTERKRTRTLGTADYREAQRRAARLEIELAQGQTPVLTTWADAVELYAGEVFPGLSVASRAKGRSTFALVGRVIAPARVAGLGEPQLARLVDHLRREGRREATVRGHLRNLRAFLNWAHRRQILDRVPNFPHLGRQPAGMRGRPITAEEFDRLLAAVPQVVGEAAAEGWRHLLRGLWLTGLRLGEALALDWTDDRRLAVDLGGEYPFFRIQAAAEKGRRFRLLPMCPEAAAFFRETPLERRRGPVFRPVNPRTGTRPPLTWASKVISRVGEAARVAVTEPRPRRPGRGPRKPPAPKWASAHDLRRAFGARLANRVRAPLLMQLMRHQSIQTTLQFYIGADAQAAARELWRELQPPANELANNQDRHHNGPDRESPEVAGIPDEKQ